MKQIETIDNLQLVGVHMNIKGVKVDDNVKVSLSTSTIIMPPRVNYKNASILKIN